MQGDPNADYVDVWEVIQYNEDRNGKTNTLKLGRAYAKEDSDVINLKLFAAPFTNRGNECWITLVPYDPNWKRGADR